LLISVVVQSRMERDEVLAIDASKASPAQLRAALKAAQAVLALERPAAVAGGTVKACSEQLACSAVPGGVSVVHGEGRGDQAPGDMFTLQQYEAMLRREHELRTCAETQALYAAAELREDTDWMEAIAMLQRRVVREAGVPPEREELALRHLRSAPHRYPQLKPLALYHR
jgi:hypothetical protein